MVATVRVDVSDPGAGVMEFGLSAHVGARAGVGETEHLRETAPLNPYTPVTPMVNTPEAPDFSVTLRGVGLIAKSGPSTT